VINAIRRQAGTADNAVVVVEYDVLVRLASWEKDAGRTEGGVTFHGVANDRQAAAASIHAVAGVALNDIPPPRRQIRIADYLDTAGGTQKNSDATIIVYRGPFDPHGPGVTQLDANVLIEAGFAIENFGDRSRDRDAVSAVGQSDDVIQLRIGRGPVVRCDIRIESASLKSMIGADV
jgi:hypothetical protein